MIDHTYLVTVSCESEEEADQVMAERIGYDEDYGFEYQIDHQRAPWQQPTDD